jgi:hypothetical protein
MYATHQIAKYSSDSRQSHGEAILYLVRYLKKMCNLVGTLEGGYVHNVPLPRIPQRQSTSPVARAATLTESTDTHYLKVPQIPT